MWGFFPLPSIGSFLLLNVCWQWKAVQNGKKTRRELSFPLSNLILPPYREPLRRKKEGHWFLTIVAFSRPYEAHRILSKICKYFFNLEIWIDPLQDKSSITYVDLSLTELPFISVGTNAIVSFWWINAGWARSTLVTIAAARFYVTVCPTIVGWTQANISIHL